MKSLKFLLLFALALPLNGVAQNSAVKAYYFHNEIRCETCRTVESEAKTDLQELYGSKVTFQALNLEEKSTQELAKKLEVSGQTLLVVKGDQKVNLTNEGFLYAVTNPDKFKAIIKERVDPLLE